MSDAPQPATMTPLQKDLARHALGLGDGTRRSYRNRFLIGPGDTHDAWSDLVAKGLATTEPADGPTNDSDWFFLTQAGAEAALNKGESLCAEDWPQSKRRSRAQERRRTASERAAAYAEKPQLVRDDGRTAWARSGLSYAALTPEALEDLRQRIMAETRLSGLFKGTFRAGKKARLYHRADGSVRAVSVFCSAYYFDNREAVTFNDGGFVGFGGELDGTNVQPILNAFIAWVDALVAAKPTARAA